MMALQVKPACAVAGRRDGRAHVAKKRLGVFGVHERVLARLAAWYEHACVRARAAPLTMQARTTCGRRRRPASMDGYRASHHALKRQRA
jgi:hypothetical protein